MSFSTTVRRAAQQFHAPAIIPHSIHYPEYTPASPQAESFHASTKDIRALFGGDRSGKTGTGAYEQIQAMREFPNTLHWCGAQTQEKIRAIWLWHKEWMAPHEYKVVRWYNRGADIPAVLIHRLTGARLEYKSFKSGAGVFASNKVKTIHLDEDPQRVTPQGEQIWNDCLSRIIQGGRIWITATPVLGKNWMYKRIYLYNAQNREDKSPDPDIDRWNVSLLDNRFITDEEKAKAKGRMSADEIDRRFYGLFTTLEGAVFKEWNERTMVTDFGTLPADIRKGVGIDLGFKHPFCAEFGAYSDDRILYFYDEHYQAEMLISDHAAEIKRIEHEMMYWRGLNYRPHETRVCDHERQTRAELEEAGIWTEPADKAVEARISLMNRMMKEGRFLVHPRCYELVRTLPLCHYKEQRLGTDQKEIVVKEDDDPCDAAGYLSMYFEGGSNYDITL